MKLYEIKKEIDMLDSRIDSVFSDAFGAFWYDAPISEMKDENDLPIQGKIEYDELVAAKHYLFGLMNETIKEYSSCHK